MLCLPNTCPGEKSKWPALKNVEKWSLALIFAVNWNVRVETFLCCCTNQKCTMGRGTGVHLTHPLKGNWVCMRHPVSLVRNKSNWPPARRCLKLSDRHKHGGVDHLVLQYCSAWSSLLITNIWHQIKRERKQSDKKVCPGRAPSPNKFVMFACGSVCFNSLVRIYSSSPHQLVGPNSPHILCKGQTTHATPTGDQQGSWWLWWQLLSSRRTCVQISAFLFIPFPLKIWCCWISSGCQPQGLRRQARDSICGRALSNTGSAWWDRS